MGWNMCMCWAYAIAKYRYVPTLDEIFSAIDDAKRMNFQHMEIEGVGRQLYTIAENKSLIKKKCTEKGVELMDFVPVLPDTMSADPKRRRKALGDFRLGCEIASYFETEMTQADTFYLPIHAEVPYDISKEFSFAQKPPSLRVDPKFDFWKHFSEVIVPSISECNDMAEDHGLRLCVEPRTWENVPNTWALELLMREVASNNLGAVLDVAHLAAQKMGIVQCVEMLGKRIFYVHASDSDFMVEDHLEIGKGSIDWVNLFKALQKHEYKGFVGIDILCKLGMKDGLDAMYLSSKRFLEDLFENL